MSAAKKLLFVLGIFSTIITTHPVTGQNPKKANIWYFGSNAGLDFSQGSPIALSNGALSSSEGAATLSDIYGNLLFYTNGGDFPYPGAVWNRNHQVMPNGFLTGSGGCNSSLQSSLIVPQPGNQNINYLFTTDCYENSYAGGLSYTIIDMNLDGGLGDVLVKGIKLTSPVNESLTGVKHANDRDYWIICHKLNTDSFYAYHMNHEGIAGVVKTAIGPIVSDWGGELKASANGERLVYSIKSKTLLFNFDANNGVIGNYVDLNTASYTAAFSTNCNFLYVGDFQSKKFYQFDLLAHNIANTKILIGWTTSLIGSLQLGPDGKIYVARNNSQYLGVINYPNLMGTNCNYINNGVYLEGKRSRFGLPNFTNDIVGQCQSSPKENTHDFNFNFRSVDFESTKVKLLWKAFGNGVSQYKLSQKMADESIWESITTHTNNYIASNLEPKTNYQFRLDAVIMEEGIYEIIHNHRLDQILENNEETLVNRIVNITTGEIVDFQLFPNPAKDNAKIEIDLGENNNLVELSIFDTGGKKVYYQSWNNLAGNQTLELPISQLQSGVYNVSIQNDGTNRNKRFIVMN